MNQEQTKMETQLKPSEQNEKRQLQERKLQRISDLFNKITFRKNKLLVHRLSNQEELTTKGGLYLPSKWEYRTIEDGIETVTEIGRELPQLCKVIAAGSNCKEIKKGDMVLIPLYLDTIVRFSIEDETFLTLTEDDVLLKVEL